MKCRAWVFVSLIMAMNISLARAEKALDPLVYHACKSFVRSAGNYRVCIWAESAPAITEACSKLRSTRNESYCLRQQIPNEHSSACHEYTRSERNEGFCLRRLVQPTVVKTCFENAIDDTEEYVCIQEFSTKR